MNSLKPRIISRLAGNRIRSIKETTIHPPRYFSINTSSNRSAPREIWTVGILSSLAILAGISIHTYTKNPIQNSTSSDVEKLLEEGRVKRKSREELQR
ncbi:hypothetical protein KEM48_000163 [Puccinia striiformis f. sp. tritici PST-130]|nr:hypothetical protein KEM48_000163 [Puccinia striiformis f. sp. tritici PST-130]